jgi:hypothetical protein
MKTVRLRLNGCATVLVEREVIVQVPDDCPDAEIEKLGDEVAGHVDYWEDSDLKMYAHAEYLDCRVEEESEEPEPAEFQVVRGADGQFRVEQLPIAAPDDLFDELQE